MKKGWIKLYRKLLLSPEWLETSPVESKIMITLMLMVEVSNRTVKFKGRHITLNVGEMITTLSEIGKQSGLVKKKATSTDKMKIKRALEKLYDRNFLDIESDRNNIKIYLKTFQKHQKGHVTLKNADNEPLVQFSEGGTPKSVTPHVTVENAEKPRQSSDSEAPPSKSVTPMLHLDLPAFEGFTRVTEGEVLGNVTPDEHYIKKERSNIISKESTLSPSTQVSKKKNERELREEKYQGDLPRLLKNVKVPKVPTKENWALRFVLHMHREFLKVTPNDKNLINARTGDWLYTLDLMWRVDKRTPKDMTVVFNFAIQDERFWKYTVHSINGFRKNYDQIERSRLRQKKKD